MPGAPAGPAPAAAPLRLPPVPEPSSPPPRAPEPEAVAAAPAAAPDGPAAAIGRDGTAAPPSIAEAVGGPLGIAESALPAALFVGVYTLGGRDTTVAAIVAVAVGAVLTAARLLRRQTPQFAISGLVGIALAGFIVSRTGRAEDFFLPGLLTNVAYAAAYLVSILVRWPLMGLVIESLSGDPTGWRKDPARVRLYSRVSWIWVGLFALRLAVQLPLYLAGALVALGVARVAMGIPLFALGIWLTWLVVKRAAPAPAAPAAPAAP
nr:DUF3159 domain-containing protein [Patulibacter sp. SYSU D01012]